MKKYFFFWAVAALILIGCGNNSQDHTHAEGEEHSHAPGTHVHEDGTVHADHTDTTGHAQEEFSVKKDSIGNKEGEHKHDAGSDHKH